MELLRIALILVSFTLALALAYAQDGGEPAAQPPPLKEPDLDPDLPEGLYAVFQTTKGDLVCRLFENETPMTVANFVGLADGTKEWVDRQTRQNVTRPFYDGLTFHRVIPGFMIQGGCPLGTGTGGPGYKFDDEIVESLKFDRPGLLAMANAGPKTNGSQFFITEEETPHLDGRHTIFGELIDEDGLLIARRIARSERDENDKPLEPVVIRRLVIKRISKVVQPTPKTEQLPPLNLWPDDKPKPKATPNRAAWE